MFKLGWFTFCESAVVDNLTNNISLFNAVEQIQAAEFPIAMPNAVFAIYAYREDQEDFSRARLEYRVNVVRPDGEVRVLFDQVIESTNPRHRIRASARGLLLDVPGLRWFTLELKAKDGTWAEVARLPFLALLVAAPEADKGVQPAAVGGVSS